jgi:hypothetical protein
MKENNIPESFENAMNDLVVGRVVPLNMSLNEPYKELDNVDSLKLHNHVLKVANDELDKENKYLKDELALYKKVNLGLRKELTMCEKLVELNMKDFWDVADQRDWYYEEYQKLKGEKK